MLLYFIIISLEEMAKKYQNWELCIILESDAAILGKKEIQVLLSGVEP